MVIGISGKKESGKDTVCKIIQAVDLYYNCPRKTGSWEPRNKFIWDFVRGDRDVTLSMHRDIESKWERVAYADKLKEVIALITNCSMYALYSHSGKESCSPIKQPNSERFYTYRELLQLFGSEVGRLISPDLWVDSLFAGYSDQDWIIPDVRFPNEAKKIIDLGGFVIRTERDGLPQDNHESETALDGYSELFSYTIKYDETLESMTEDVVKIMVERNLITL